MGIAPPASATEVGRSRGQHPPRWGTAWPQTHLAPQGGGTRGGLTSMVPVCAFQPALGAVCPSAASIPPLRDSYILDTLHLPSRSSTEVG